MVHKSFIINLEDQMQKISEKNEKLESILDGLGEVQNTELDTYIYDLTNLMLMQNNEKLELMNSILKNIFRDRGKN